MYGNIFIHFETLCQVGFQEGWVNLFFHLQCIWGSHPFLKLLQCWRAPSVFMCRLTDGDIYESFAMLGPPVSMAVTMDANHWAMEEARTLQSIWKDLVGFRAYWLNFSSPSAHQGSVISSFLWIILRICMAASLGASYKPALGWILGVSVLFQACHGIYLPKKQGPWPWLPNPMWPNGS